VGDDERDACEPQKSKPPPSILVGLQAAAFVGDADGGRQSVGAAGDARLAASWRRRRELVAGGEGPSRLGADGASGGRRPKCRAAGGRRCEWRAAAQV
jgi:hypothetical protein